MCEELRMGPKKQLSGYCNGSTGLVFESVVSQQCPIACRAGFITSAPGKRAVAAKTCVLSGLTGRVASGDSFIRGAIFPEDKS